MALVPKRGISALVSPTFEADRIASCLLFIAHSEANHQATVYLQFSVYIRGIDQKQPFELVYDADNLVPGKTRLGPENKVLPSSRLEEIARDGRCRLHSLSLSLKQPCVVKCPPCSDSISPKDAADPCFSQLANLAKQTEVHILFDYSWVHESNRIRFENLIGRLEKFTGTPRANKDTDQSRFGDWTVFTPVQEEIEAPPSYAEASHKRSRSRGSSTAKSPPEYVSPPPKRILLPPFPSPTELATPSPKLPGSPPARAPEFQQAVEAEVKKVLPGLLEAAVADVVRSLLRTSPSLASVSSPSPPASTVAPSPPRLDRKPPRALTSRNTLLLSQAKHRVQTFIDNTVDDVTSAQAIAINELREEVDDYNVEIALAKQDYIMELETLYNSKLEELRDIATDVITEVDEHVADVYSDLRHWTKRDLLSGTGRKIGRGSAEKVNDDNGGLATKRPVRATSFPL
ncbi:unnamed protein product [Periconia digitata]|uniref:Uncharacterized protein n=1 Tax=Periconia digitata TaxID=1303443 RepID=A0A9W4XFR1_9PLEO|nr:unnamed protein product [Periconia digitata]